MNNDPPQYTQAPPARTPRFLIPILLGGVLLFLGLIIFGGVTAFKGGMRTTKAAVAVADKFFQTMVAGKYQSAYAMLTPQIQSTTTPAEMKDLQDLLIKRHGPVTYHQTQGWYINSNNGVTTVTLNYQVQYAGGSKPVKVIVMDTPAGMKIYGYHYNY